MNLIQTVLETSTPKYR